MTFTTVRLLRPLAAALVLLMLPVSAYAAAPRRVAVLPLGSLGVDEDVASSLLGFLRAEVGKIPGFTVVDLSKQGRVAGADCKGEEKCLAAAGVKYGADEVVSGTVAGVGEAYSIDLKRVVVRTGKEDARITELISGEREVLIDGVRGAAFKLLLPSQYVGTIQLDLAEAGAEVFVDGRAAGKTPLKAPIPNLPPGKHALKIVKPGFADFDKWIDVRFSRVSVVKVDLKNSSITGVMFEKEAPAEPKPEVAAVGPSEPVAPPVVVKPVFFTGQRIGAVVAAALGLGIGGTGIYFALQAKSETAAIKKLQDAAGTSGGVLPGDRSEALGRLRAVQANAMAADIFWAAGGVAVAAGVVLFATGGQATPTIAVGPGGATVGVAGRF